MTEPNEATPVPDHERFPFVPGQRVGWLQRRREKVFAEIERNRRGEYKIPTWVLAVALVAIVAIFVVMIVSVS